ncbi:hypothetical protein K2173_019029 [Erythroxylum novogranatense]|uniref:Uncharacterized protein n=1 Tax=Erythroxylum novogranatense TaxID=1862640 RepID=A0AAV8SSH7_9ROSI|nr:hypothetical protein K2173_019029 [Erythroxylum novogranatense]
MHHIATTAPSSANSNKEDLDPVLDTKLAHRWHVTLSLGGIALGLQIGGSNALAARGPPPPPPEEDPNVSGLEAKVLSSKKRKEATKEAVAKLRKRGKTISEPSE